MASSTQQKIEQFARQVIELHGFQLNDGFSCIIPDKEPFPSKEGQFLWGFSHKRKRFETKVEKFHTSTRLKRMDEMLGLSDKDYDKLFSAVEAYLGSLKKLGFEEIGKGVILFKKAKVYNVQADAKLFENNLEVLKEFEEITINNPIVEFAANYFEVKNPKKLAWDEFFGGGKTSTSTKNSSKASAKVPPKATAKASTKASPKVAAKVSQKATTKTSPKASPKASSAKASAKEASAKVSPKTSAKATAKAPAVKGVAKAAKASPKAPPKVSSPKASPKALPKSSPKVTKKPSRPSSPTAATMKAGTSAVSGSEIVATATKPLADKFKKLADNQPILALDLKVWVRQVNGLYKDVQKWLSEHSKNNYVTFNYRKVNLSEANVGDYEIDSLELGLVGGQQVIFKPVEMNMLGTIGRVDLYLRGKNFHQAMLLLKEQGNKKLQWELLKSLDDKQQSFDKQALEALFLEWID